MLTPQNTYLALLIVQALHILHHRLAKRHISFAEVVSAIVLCVPPWAPLPAWMFIGVHLSLIAVQVVGSLWIKKLSPEWSAIKP
jgi:hypothetical protein